MARRCPLQSRLSRCHHQQTMVPLFRLPVLFALAAGARRRAFVDAGCRCQPARALRPNCPVGKLPADIDYRRAAGALPLAMCIGDSVSGPSCRAAAAGLADRLELRSVEFPPMLTRTPRRAASRCRPRAPASCVLYVRATRTHLGRAVGTMYRGPTGSRAPLAGECCSTG